MNTISPISLRLPTTGVAETPRLQEVGRPNQDVPSFEQTLKDFVSETNQVQQQAGVAARQLVSGQTNDIHQVMIMSEKAGIAFELLMEVRNKLVEGYQNVMRMPV